MISLFLFEILSVAIYCLFPAGDMNFWFRSLSVIVALKGMVHQASWLCISVLR